MGIKCNRDCGHDVEITPDFAAGGIRIAILNSFRNNYRRSADFQSDFAEGLRRIKRAALGSVGRPLEQITEARLLEPVRLREGCIPRNGETEERGLLCGLTPKTRKKIIPWGWFRCGLNPPISRC